MPPSTGTFPARISTESFPDMTPHPRKMIGIIRFAGVLLAGLTLHSNGDLFAQPPVAPAVAPRGGKVFIADVVIQGNRHLSTQQIMAQLGTKPGNEYEPHQVQDDVRKLMATRQFAQVDPRFETLPEGKVVIYFLIKDYPSVVQKVVYQGAKHLSDEELGALTSVVKGKPLSPVTNKLGCQAIVRKYQEMGRMWASCELIKGAEPGDKEVIYNITEGPVVKVKSLFPGGFSKPTSNQANKSLAFLAGPLILPWQTMTLLGLKTTTKATAIWMLAPVANCVGPPTASRWTLCSMSTRVSGTNFNPRLK